MTILGVRKASCGAALMVLVGVASAMASEVRDLPVPVATIYPDSVIASRDLRLRTFKTSPGSLTGIAVSLTEIAGKQARRRLVAGKPIPVAALAEPQVVRKGEQVSAVFTEEGLSIIATVSALENGSAGDTIRARNAATGVIVSGVVQLDGTVRVDGP